AARQLAAIVAHYAPGGASSGAPAFDLDALPRIDGVAAMAHDATAVASSRAGATVRVHGPGDATTVDLPARAPSPGTRDGTEVSPAPTAARDPSAFSTEVVAAPLPSAVPTRTIARGSIASEPPATAPQREFSPHDRTRTMVVSPGRGAATTAGRRGPSGPPTEVRARAITAISLALMLLSAAALVRVLLAR
ncbi:MAG: hypothetical protein WCJ30_00240, partial [Deltaproteobacteria bacterium]